MEQIPSSVTIFISDVNMRVLGTRFAQRTGDLLQKRSFPKAMEYMNECGRKLKRLTKR